MHRMWRGLATLGVGVALTMTTSGVSIAADDDWPTYHHSADRAGNAAVGSSFSDVQPGWTTGGLDGAVYAEPLYVGGKGLVATENNSIYAIDPPSGGPLWQTPPADPGAAGTP